MLFYDILTTAPWRDAFVRILQMGKLRPGGEVARPRSHMNLIRAALLGFLLYPRGADLE